LEEDESNTSETDFDSSSSDRAESAEADAGLFSSPETASESRIPVSLSSPKRPFHDVESNDFTETTQNMRLAEQEALPSDSMRPYGQSSRPSSEPLHDRISTEDRYTDRAISEATMSRPARPAISLRIIFIRTEAQQPNMSWCALH
jgi:hypothetical protein